MRRVPFFSWSALITALAEPALAQSEQFLPALVPFLGLTLGLTINLTAVWQVARANQPPFTDPLTWTIVPLEQRNRYSLTDAEVAELEPVTLGVRSQREGRGVAHHVHRARQLLQGGEQGRTGHHRVADDAELARPVARRLQSLLTGRGLSEVPADQRHRAVEVDGHVPAADPLGEAHGGDRAQRRAERMREADEFYSTVIPTDLAPDARNVMRQALAGMIWSKQFFHYDVARWLEYRMNLYDGIEG